MKDHVLLDALDAVSLAGSRLRPNEDAFGRAFNRAWVIDGATGLGDPIVSATSDAAWLANRASEFFARHARIDDTHAMMAAVAADLEAAFHAERGRAPLAPWETPCASFMMLTTREESRIELAFLGDCRAILCDAGDKAEGFGANRASEAREAKEVPKYAALDPAARYRTPEALAMLRMSRSRYNAPDGPAILAPERSFAARVHLEPVTLKRPAHALLMTDGFSALELRYQQVSEAAFVPTAREKGLSRLADRLRKIEEDFDADCSRFPRWKRCDDATAMLLSLL